MCQVKNIHQRNDSIPSHVEKTHENLKNYFNQNITVFLTGNGDVLARKDTRSLLQKFNTKKYNKVKFQLLTNGLLFQPRIWETIKHNNFTYANISVDGATKETYEKIRRGGKWEQLLKALNVFRIALEKGKFSSVNLNMTLMRSNFREIPRFIEMARARGFYASFHKVRGQCGDENIFQPGDAKALKELKLVLSDPALYGDDVDLRNIAEYVPAEFHDRLSNHLTTIWHPSRILKKNYHC
jgi:sulfatase maturation enzyme AslB (radical SAM superfamily)